MLSTIPALFLFDRLGRRKLLIFCGLGMVIGHLVAATVFVTGCNVTKTVINGSTVTEEVVKCGSKFWYINAYGFTADFCNFFCSFLGTNCLDLCS